MEDSKKDTLVLVVGFTLIAIILVFMVVRAKYTEKNTNDALQKINESSDEKASAKTFDTISANDLQNKINSNEKLTILDVRPFESYINEHIIDSVNIEKDQLNSDITLDLHSPIIVIGENSGDDKVNQSIQLLTAKGASKVMILAGGMESWKQLIGITITYGNPKSFIDQAKVTYTDAATVKAALADPKIIILDIRKPEEFSNNHIQNAINIPFEEIEKRRKDLPISKKIVVVGNNELQEFQAAVQIFDLIMSSPAVMKGAMPSWIEQKFPLVK